MYNDLREFIKVAEDLGQVKVIEGADWDLEIGVITELSQSKPDQPLLLFDKIKGYPPGYRTATNALNNFKLIALANGLPLEARGLELVKAWRDKTRKDFKLLPPVKVKSGPIEENIMMGDDIDLLKFPAAKWHEFDAGRYIGTGDIVITRDPDTGWVNLGTMRVQVHDKAIANINISPPSDTNYIRQKYWAKGQSCPIAVVCGGDPRLVTIAGSTLAPRGVNDYDYVGWLRKKPVEVIKGKTVDLPIPANAEIVLEGEMGPPGVDDRIEGPYGEGKGYYEGSGLQPVMRVTCIMHRNAPILLGYPPLCGDYELRYGMHIPKAAVIWDELERRIPGVKGVWLMNEARNPIAVVSIEQQYVGHAKEAAIVTAGCFTWISPMPTRFIIIVDDDIDPSNLSQVMFALGTRCNPENAIDIIKGLPTSLTSSEVIVSPEKKRTGEISLGKAFIYACKPYAWINDVPRSNKCRTELLEEASRKWGDLLFEA
jgi:UbiD family decarboxylase